MSANLCTQRLNRLFQQWREKSYGNQGIFNADGILNEEQWEKARPRVLLLMKDTYEYDGDLRELLNRHVEEPERPQHCSSWPQIAGGWIAGILHQEVNKEQPGDVMAFERLMREGAWRRGLAASAVVNLKKLTGKSVAKDSELLAAAKQDAAFLRKEL